MRWARTDRRVTATVFERCDAVNDSVVNEVVRVQPGFHDDIYGMAVDVGTTTVAGHLCNLRTGEMLASSSRMNPQVPYGEDLMSRISYVMMNDDGTERMHTAIIDGLNELAEEVCEQAGITSADMVEIVIVGNTTMHHLVLGVNPVELGGAPFSLVTHNAVDVKARDLGLKLGARRQRPFSALRGRSRRRGQCGCAGGRMPASASGGLGSSPFMANQTTVLWPFSSLFFGW